MYDICAYIWLIFMMNVGKYTIRGSYGYENEMAISFQKKMGFRIWGVFYETLKMDFWSKQKWPNGQSPIVKCHLSNWNHFFSASNIKQINSPKPNAELPGYSSGSLTGPKRKVFHLPTPRISHWTLQWKGQIEPVKTRRGKDPQRQFCVVRIFRETILFSGTNSLVGGFSPTHLKNMRVRQNGWVHLSPRFRAEQNKNASEVSPASIGVL